MRLAYGGIGTSSLFFLLGCSFWGVSCQVVRTLKQPCGESFWPPTSSSIRGPSRKQILQLWASFPMARSASWWGICERFLARTTWLRCSWIPDTPKTCEIINVYYFNPLTFGVICCVDIDNKYTAWCVLPVESGPGKLNLIKQSIESMKKQEQVSRFKVAPLGAVFQNKSLVASAISLEQRGCFSLLLLCFLCVDIPDTKLHSLWPLLQLALSGVSWRCVCGEWFTFFFL